MSIPLSPIKLTLMAQQCRYCKNVVTGGRVSYGLCPRCGYCADTLIIWAVSHCLVIFDEVPV